MNARLGLMAVVAAFLVAGTGCESTKQKAERDSLINQNKELQQQLDAERTARTAADSRANAATGQLTAAQPADSATPPGMEGGAVDLSSGTASGGRGSRNTRSSSTSTDIGGGVTSSVNGAGELVLGIPGDVLFDSGKATIKPTAKKTLDTIASTLKSKYGGQQIRVEGHTDPSPVKSSGWDDNWDLGAARARQVMLYLSQKGVKDMYIASFAATELKSTKNQSLNRRVDIVVVKNAR